MCRLMGRPLFAAILVLALDSAQAAGWIVEGRVVAVSDGDTITVLDGDERQHKIRLSGIDAPEKGQAFGERSKQSLSTRRFTEQV
jgi:endonuclease YncB( thermonuclease family)